MNRIHGIGYPVFELPSLTPGTPSKKQPVSPAGTMDASANLDRVTVETQQSALGINPVAVLVNQLTKKPNQNPPDQTPNTPVD